MDALVPAFLHPIVLHAIDLIAHALVIAQVEAGLAAEAPLLILLTAVSNTDEALSLQEGVALLALLATGSIGRPLLAVGDVLEALPLRKQVAGFARLALSLVSVGETVGNLRSAGALAEDEPLLALIASRPGVLGAVGNGT